LGVTKQSKFWRVFKVAPFIPPTSIELILFDCVYKISYNLSFVGQGCLSFTRLVKKDVFPVSIRPPPLRKYWSGDVLWTPYRIPTRHFIFVLQVIFYSFSWKGRSKFTVLSMHFSLSQHRCLGCSCKKIYHARPTCNFLDFAYKSKVSYQSEWWNRVIRCLVSQKKVTSLSNMSLKCNYRNKIVCGFNVFLLFNCVLIMIVW